MFAEAAVTVDRSRKAEKRYEDYKKSQEARVYNHPGHDARRVLKEKLQTLHGTSCREGQRLTRILADMGALPSHQLSDVVAYNEHNHLSEEVLAQDRRKTAIVEGEKRLNDKHGLVDQNLKVLQDRLEELTKEKQAREIFRELRPSPVDPNEVAVEKAVTTHQANVERVVAVEVRYKLIGLTPDFLILFVLLQTSLQTITSAEEIPHKDGPIQALEGSFPTPDCQSIQLQEFAEGIARLIYQVPLVRKEIASIKTENEERKEAEKVVSTGVYVDPYVSC